MVRRRRSKKDRDGLELDPERDITARHCDGCGRDYLLVKGFLFKAGVPHAVYFAACHEHDEEREAWIDLILGTFGNDDVTDHVTFGTRTGPVQGQSDPAATLVPAAAPYGDSPIFGTKLSREEALVHERLPECWEALDFILLEDETVNHHVYH